MQPIKTLKEKLQKVKELISSARGSADYDATKDAEALALIDSILASLDSPELVEKAAMEILVASGEWPPEETRRMWLSGCIIGLENSGRDLVIEQAKAAIEAITI